MSGTNKFVPTEALGPEDCKGLADVLISVGDKWTLLVVGALSRGQLRYNEIQRRVSDISQRMLTLTIPTRPTSEGKFRSGSLQGRRGPHKEYRRG